VLVPVFKKNYPPHGSVRVGPRVVGRLWSVISVSASLQIFALTARENVLRGEGNCPGGGMSGGVCLRRKCPTHSAHAQHSKHY